MASCDYLFKKVVEVGNELATKKEETDLERSQRFYAAVVLQSVWRGRNIRLQYKILHNAAIVIQKWVKRYLVRINLPEILLEQAYLRHRQKYDKAAIKIQALWRGYAYRKTNTFHKDYTYKHFILKKNQELKEKMEEQHRLQQETAKKEIEQEAKDMVMYLAFKLHHQLRTYVTEGVYSIHGSHTLSLVEKIMASTKFTKLMKEYRKEYYEELKQDKIKTFYKVPKFKKTMPGIVHDKPFCLDTKIERKYEAMLKPGDFYSEAIKNVGRKTDRSKFICKEDFDVTHRKAPPKTFAPPFLNHWNKGCEVHDIF